MYNRPKYTIKGTIYSMIDEGGDKSSNILYIQVYLDPDNADATSLTRGVLVQSAGDMCLRIWAAIKTGDKMADLSSRLTRRLQRRLACQSLMHQTQVKYLACDI